MKKFILLIVSFLVGIGLFVWIAKTVGWQEIKNSFLVFTGRDGLVIFVLTLLIMLIGNWKWQEILKGEGIRISFFSLFRPFLAGFSVMFLAPILLWGGEIFRSYILKRNNDVPWTKGLTSVIVDRILEWTANLVVILFGVLIFLLMIGFPPMNLAIIFGGVFLFFTLGISFFYLRTFRRKSMAKIAFRLFGLKNIKDNNVVLQTEKEMFDFFRLKNKTFWTSFILSFFRAGVMYIRTGLLIFFLGKSIGALPVLSILGFTYLAVMIPIPTALGSHEAIQTFTFDSLGLGISTATVFTMILRGAELIIALAGVVVIFRYGILIIKDNFFNKIDKIADKDNAEI